MLLWILYVEGILFLVIDILVFSLIFVQQGCMLLLFLSYRLRQVPVSSRARRPAACSLLS